MIAIRGIPRWVVPVFGYAISAASLIWVFSKFPYHQLGDHLRTMDWNWVGIAVILELVCYLVDAWRWKALLNPAGRPSYRICLQAVFIGLFASDVLPARAGEAVRVFLVSYESDVVLSLSITSDVILRIMDGIWIVLLYLLVTFQIGTHTDVSRVMWFLGIAMSAVAALMLYVLFRRHHAHHFVRNRSWAARFTRVLDEIHRLGNWRELGLAFLGSGGFWFLQALAIWALARADAFDFGVGAAVFLLVVKAVGTLIPNAPANVGVYQAALMYGMSLLLVEHANAQIFAEITFWILTLPAVACGAIAIAAAGIDITDLHRHARIAHEHQHLSPPAAEASHKT